MGLQLMTPLPILPQHMIPPLVLAYTKFSRPMTPDDPANWCTTSSLVMVTWGHPELQMMFVSALQH